jgi:hypothetical protein
MEAMSSSLELIPVQSHYDDSSKVDTCLFVGESVNVDGVGVSPIGKLITPKGITIETARQIAVVQHGLPGVQWRKDSEKRVVDSLREDQVVFFLMPRGMKLSIDSLNVASCNSVATFGSSMGADKDADFNMAHFVRGSAALWANPVLQNALENKKSGIGIGHSYGASTLLYALRFLQNAEMQYPSKLSFLAPFVKIALGTKDPKIALSTANKDLVSVSNESEKAHKRRLRTVLRECLDWYSFQDDEGNKCKRTTALLNQHAAVFNEAYFRHIGNLDGLEVSPVGIYLGGKDEYIDSKHADLLRICMSTCAFIVTKYPKMDHSLSSANWRAFL